MTVTDLPAEVKFGKVTGRFLLTAVDSVDAGSMPDVLAGEGSVKFVPRQPNQRVTTPELAIVTHRPVICSLDANGYLVDSQGQPEVWLATGIYEVTFSIKNVRIAPLVINVTEEYTELAPMDLALAIPPYGLPFGAGQYAELSARIGAVEDGGGSGSAPQVARLVYSAAKPADADAGAVINAELATLSTYGPIRLQLGGGRLTIGTSIVIPTGCELVGLGPRVTELFTATDMPAIAFRGGAAQGIRSLKIQNAATGVRTTYDVFITNPTKPVFEDVEISNAPTSSGAGGIRLFGTTKLAGENTFMPQLSRVWINAGRLVIDGVTDGHFTDGYVWATNRTGGGAVELLTVSDGWTFTSVDVVPPLGDGAGYSLANTNNTEIIGGYCDGSYSTVLTGYGIKAVNSGRLFVSAYRFYRLGRSGLHLTNTHGCAFTTCGFFNNNKLDAGYPDIDLYDSDGNTFEGNVHTCYDPRTSGGLTYRADGSSTYNSIDNCVVDLSLGVTYVSPYNQGDLLSFGRRNRPGVFWARPAGTPNSIVPAASTLTLATAATAWPASNAALFHRFTVEFGGYYRYARFRCSAAAGNMQTVVVSLNNAGTTYTKVMDSGVIPVTTGDLSVDMAQTFLNPGEYAIGLWCDNNTATFWHMVSPALPSMAMAAKITSGLTGGIPATGAIAWNGDRYVSALALALN